MQLLWKMFKKNQFEANIDECGIEIGTPHGGYQYEVTKPPITSSGVAILTSYIPHFAPYCLLEYFLLYHKSSPKQRVKCFRLQVLSSRVALNVDT
ncbi:hypothetical protein [Staphylococcus pseudintermedius]|uniref:hypothetical protein n=1 Tax=Staphylococcus pseudintermedius TaxID=283734 RepID=UPI0035901311